MTEPSRADTFIHMNARIQTVLLLLAASVAAGGCFRDPDLSSCGPEKACDQAFPLCEEGLCFHHTFGYVVPPCSTGAGEPCCSIENGQLEKDGGCVLAEVDFAGSVLSAPVAGTDGRFFFTRRSQDGKLFLVARGAVAPGNGVAPAWEVELLAGTGAQDGTTEGGEPEGAAGNDGGGDDGLSAGGFPPAPAVTRQGLVVVAAGGTVFAYDGDGVPWTGWPEGKINIEGELTGSIAACDSGAVAWTTTEAVWQVLPGKEPASLPLEIGPLPEGLGVLRHEGTGRLVVPTGSGARVVGVVPVGNSGLLAKDEKLDLGEQELPGGVLGLALDREGFSYVLTYKGVLRSLPLAEGALANSAWVVEAAAGVPVAGPVLQEPGVALMSLKKGGIYQAVEESPGDVELVRSGPVLEQLVALRLGGFAGVVPGEGTVSFVVDSGASLLEEGKEGSFDRIDWAAECKNPSMSLPSAQGVVAATCGSSLRLLVAPEYPSPEFDWPGPRGWGNSGCR